MFSGRLQRTVRSSRSGLAALGSDLLHHWEVPAAAGAFLTLDGSNVSSLADRVSSGLVAMAQGTAGNRPAHNATGGPGNGPYVSLQGGSRFLSAATPYANGHRVASYVVMAMPVDDSHEIYVCTESASFRFEFRNELSGTRFGSYAEFTGGQQAYDVASPAWNTGWHLQSFEPRSSGARWEIDGVLVGSTYTGSDTLTSYSTTYIGGPSGISNGSVALVIHVNDPNAYKRDVVKEYVRKTYGLAIA
jgi:hypothetical protein